MEDVKEKEKENGIEVLDRTDSNPQQARNQHFVPRNGLSIAERRLIKRLLTTVALGIPLTWSRKLNEVNKKIVSDLELTLCP